MTIVEVKVVTNKMVRPSVATPDHLKTHKLTSFDQIAPPDQVPIIYFYSASNMDNIREQLQESLSRTLTKLYPLAGRFVQDGFYVDCNDEGALYVEAKVNLSLNEFIAQAKKNIQLINDLVPKNNFVSIYSIDNPIVGLQVSFFECGGLAICMYLSHIVADGYTAAAFTKEWSSTTYDMIHGDQVISSYPMSFGLGSLVPSRDLSTVIKPAVMPASKTKEIKVVTRRFVFDEKALSTFKDHIIKSESVNRPTRVEVVTSVLWKALIKQSKLPSSTLYFHLNFRGKTGITSPPLDKDFAVCGNYYTQVPTRFKGKNETRDELELHELVKLLRGKLRNTLKNISEISTADGLFLEAAKNFNIIQEDVENEEVDVRIFTTLCRMPLYETEFGWGKPEWVTIPEMHLEIVFLLDTKCGTGIEALVSMNEADMLQFELDPTISAFAS